MNFKELYLASKKEIKNAILGLWKEKVPEMYKTYEYQLTNIVEQCISDNIVVENMANWTQTSAYWRGLIKTNIFNRTPYSHQYESWKALLQDNKSIVVTSGTGSGKTECFMIPLIEDLIDNQTNDQRTEAVEAIFLYPLNALMEDQKERLNYYIEASGRDLEFAVYNGSTKENAKDDNDGALDHEIKTRDLIRSQKPNILLTNPSMLEYMLLRDKDKYLFSDKLKWIVIDETHTFNGSAGAELSMLIRRILQACNIEDANKIKFVTSSATISGDNGYDELKKFISNITGQQEDKIEVITGERATPNTNVSSINDLLKEKNFVNLKELIPDGTIEEKLEKLDSLADNGLKVRLHYYLQALNNGLYIDPSLHKDGQFELLTTIPISEGKINTQILDACYCTHCGSLLGYGEYLEGGSFKKITRKISTLEDVNDVEDVEDNIDDDSNDNTVSDNNNESSGKSTDLFYIGLNNESSEGITYILNEENRLQAKENGVYLLKKVEEKIRKNKDGIKYKEQLHYCPCCGECGNEKSKLIRTFHMSPDFLSRLIAPILLKQTTPATNNADEKPSQGCKFITFADSRQSVAGPAMKQNLETEEVWVTGVLYKKLLEKKDSENKVITWNEALECLFSDDNCERMFKCFNDAKTMQEYCLAALYRVMHKRPANGKNSPENLGFIKTMYPILGGLKNRDLPPTINELNELLIEENKIDSEDWYDFVKLYINYDIRSNERFFFEYDPNIRYYRQKNGVWRSVDINSIRSYRTEEQERRQIEIKKETNNRFTNLLARLFGKDSYSKLDAEKKSVVKNVMNQLEIDLTTYNISESHRYINVDNNKIEWKEGNLKYMNLANIAFTLYDEQVWFDSKLRIPLDTTFKGYSPYRDVEKNIYNVKCEKKSLVRFTENSITEDINIEQWWTINRSLILDKWNYKIKRILEFICAKTNTLYFQAEHTAQVARNIIKERTDNFKKGEINIMACSTTMEMGVDLGDLELVLMNNVPPHPANYKQRAGRAGRGDQNKSSCITICGSDATGVATMNNPLEGLITRPVKAPSVTHDSSQLVQRHINSFLLREWIMQTEQEISVGAELEYDRGIKVGQFFSNYRIDKKSNKDGRNNKDIQVIFEATSFKFPNEYKSILTDDFHNTTKYKQFIKWLEDNQDKDTIKQNIRELISNTNLKGTEVSKLIEKTKERITSIANDLDRELTAIKESWKNEYLDDQYNVINYGKRLNYDFTSLYNKNLFAYLSTHQFTPNANMPTDVVELLISSYSSTGKDNPSRSMKVALYEYAPGQRVFVDGKTYTMGGVEWNKAFSNQEIKHCKNGHTWIGASTMCPKCNEEPTIWDDFGESISLLKPTKFVPYKDTSRITHKETIMYEIGTELVGVDSFENNNKIRLFSNRGNTGSGEILYFNKGFGKGFYICRDCGYTVAVPLNTSNQTETEIIKTTLGLEHDYREGYKHKIKNAEIKDKVFKNIVLGGTIQTDFCEISLYNEINEKLTYADEEVAYTLAILLRHQFALEYGYDEKEIDFIIRYPENGLSICIYDTAPGGLGYSKRLNNQDVIERLFDQIRGKLETITSSYEIVDRATMKYVDKINIDETRNWLQKEYDYRQIVPDEVQQLFPNKNVRISSYFNIERSIKNLDANQNCLLFFNGKNDEKWNAFNGDICWNTRRFNLNADNNTHNKTFVVYDLNTQITSGVEEMMLFASRRASWQSYNNILGVFPIAKIDNLLYFTTNKDYSLLNGVWGSKDIYVVDFNDELQLNNLNYVLVGDEHLIIDRNTSCRTTGIFDLIYSKSERLRHFIEQAHGHSLSFIYHEEYLRNHLSMTIAVQFVLKLAEKANANVNRCVFQGEEYDIYYNNNQSLTSCFRDHEERDNYLISTFIKPLVDNGRISEGACKSLTAGELPHWRDLCVVDNDTNAEIHILPNGGIANGWTLDRNVAYQDRRSYYPNNCEYNTDIPIINKDNPLLYDIKVGEL